MHHRWRASLPALTALALLLLAFPVGASPFAPWRISEETHEETRGHAEPARLGAVAARSVGVRRRHRLLPRRHVPLARPRPHVRLLEALARQDTYKRPLRC